MRPSTKARTPIVVPGGTVTLHWTVRNVGTAPSGDFSNSFYLSADATLSPTDTLLDGNSNSGLGAGAMCARNGPTLTIPASTAPGTYYIGILVDRTNAVGESIETNNYFAVPLTVAFAGNPWTSSGPEGGLVVALAIDRITPTTVYAGTAGGGVFQLQQVLAIVKAGTGTGSVTSSPAGIDCGGTCTASFASGTLVTLTAPPASGSSFAGWSGGGCSGTGTCEVSGNATVTATFVLPVPDLTVTTVTTAATTAPGARLAVTVTVRNQGGEPARASTMRFYLSRHTVRGPGDRLLSPSQRFPALGAGGVESRTVTVVVPRTLLPGAYFVLACADDLLRRVAESDETNNCLASASVSVTGPDLVVDGVMARGSSVVAGGRIAVVATLRNAGGVGSRTSVMRFYLALERRRAPTDRDLGRGTPPFGPLAPGASAARTVPLTVPATTPAGTYFVLACADDLGRIAESDETNNCGASATRVTITAAP